MNPDLIKESKLSGVYCYLFAVFPAAAVAKAGLAPFAVKIFQHYIKILAIIIGINFPIVSHSQNINISDEIISIAEDLASDETDQEMVNLYLEQLYELQESPVKINSADETEISRLFFLSDFQVKSLADHILKNGHIESVYELALLTGFDRHTVELMAPFIDLVPRSTSPPSGSKPLNMLLSNFIISPGENDTSCVGLPFRLLTKYRFTAARFTAGFTTEKDNGEKMFDFFSGHVTFTGTGIVRKIILGDFSCRSGQGIHLNTGIKTGLSLTSAGYKAARNEIRPYTSTGENNFFRGIAAQLSFKRAGLTAFLSYNDIDATLSANEDSTEFFVKQLYESGIHNTPSLLVRKDAVTEIAFGAGLTYSFRRLKTGFSFSESHFSLPLLSDRSDPENIHDFEGTINRVYSVHYNSLLERILLYGEISVNSPGNYAMIQGITIRPSDRLTMNLLLRNYSPGYTAFHAACPGTSSSNSNEQGIMGNFIFEAARHLFISAGCDISRYPWLRYRCSYPSMTKRMEIRLSYNPSENMATDFSFNVRSSMIDINEGTGIAGIYETETRTLRGQIKYRLSENLTMLTRADLKMAEPSGSKGMLLLQDLVCSFQSIPVDMWFRFCLFNTDSWDSRLYTYENDLLYSFTIPALSGRGSRSYLMVKWEIGKRAEIRGKYSMRSLATMNNNAQEKDELKIQARIWF